MLKKLDLGITHYIENISSRDQSLVRMGTSRVTLVITTSSFQDEKNMRPVDIEADVKEMERRKRVEAIMQSQVRINTQFKNCF